MVLNPSASPRPFCMELSPSTHWHTRFLYCCSLYNVFFLGFRQWRSSTDRVLTLNMNIRLPLFWSTWSPALGQDSATCAGLAHGRDYSYCRASELKLQKFLATVYSWILEITFKHRLQRGVSKPHPPDCILAVIEDNRDLLSLKVRLKFCPASIATACKKSEADSKQWTFQLVPSSQGGAEIHWKMCSIRRITSANLTPKKKSAQLQLTIAQIC